MTVLSRLATPEDEPYLRDLIVSHTADELGASFWPEPMRTHLLEMQYNSRRQSIRANFPMAQERIVLIDGEPAGWLVIAEVPGEIHLVEILIAHSCRGRGAGTDLILQVLERAEKAGIPVRLKVEASKTRAIRLYERLGFRSTGGDEMRCFMERSFP